MIHFIYSPLSSVFVPHVLFVEPFPPPPPPHAQTNLPKQTSHFRTKDVFILDREQ